MTGQQLFSADEWQTLQFGAIDVFMMTSQVDGEGGMDAAEQDAFMDLLENPATADDRLVRELLTSIAHNFPAIFDAYGPQYKFAPEYFESSFTKVGSLLDTKLDIYEAQNAKVALAVGIGSAIANASGTDHADLGRVSETELTAVAAIGKMLGTDMSG